MFGKHHSFSNYCVPLIALNMMVSLGLKAQVEVDAETNDYLKIMPNNCVSIAQGRDCYTDIEISWQLSFPKTVCLFKQGVEKSIACWAKANKGTYLLTFVEKKDTRYILVDPANNEVLFSETMSVTWVYKESRKKRRWRIF
jgi:hypothetical protein